MPKRAPKKPKKESIHDPLGGPEEAAAAARKEAEEKAEAERMQRLMDGPVDSEIRAYKVVGQLVGQVLNDDGEVIGEVAMMPVNVFAADFGRFKELVEEGLAAQAIARSAG